MLDSNILLITLININDIAQHIYPAIYSIGKKIIATNDANIKAPKINMHALLQNLLISAPINIYKW